MIYQAKESVYPVKAAVCGCVCVHQRDSKGRQQKVTERERGRSRENEGVDKKVSSNTLKICADIVWCDGETKDR